MKEINIWVESAPLDSEDTDPQKLDISQTVLSCRPPQGDMVKQKEIRVVERGHCKYCRAERNKKREELQLH